MGNPRQCAVCRTELTQVTESRTAGEPDVMFGDEGFGTEWNTRTIITRIYCPKCQLLYRVSDPDEQ